jgi:3-methyladenine DNA glycosylase AlkD
VSNPDLPAGVEAAVTSALKDLEKLSTKRDFDNLERFGITASKAFGVSVANIQVVARRLGRDHALADALWKSGWYEARMLASFVDEPDRVTRRRWIAGAGISITGASATRSAFTSSIEPRMRGRRS